MADIPTRDKPTSSTQLLQLFQLKALFETYPDFPKNFTQPARDPAYEPASNGPLIIRVALVWMLLALMAVSARLLLRARWEGLKMGWDDWFMIPSTVLALVLTIIQIVAVTDGGLGRHVYDNYYAQIGVSLKLIFVHIIVYFWAVTFTKTSILLFLWRLAPPTSAGLRRTIIGLIAFHYVLLLVACLVFGLECHPNAAAWEINVLVQGTRCLDLPAIMLTLNIIFVLSDIAVVLLPVRMILQLRLPERIRFAIVSLFGIGIFVCICCIMKMVYFRRYYQSFDLTHYGAYALIWGHLESTIGIVTASLPTLNVLFVSMIPKWFKGSSALEYNRTLPTDLERGTPSALDKHGRFSPAFVSISKPGASLKQVHIKEIFEPLRSVKFRWFQSRLRPSLRGKLRQALQPVRSSFTKMRLRRKFKRLSSRKWNFSREPPNPWSEKVYYTPNIPPQRISLNPGSFPQQMHEAVTRVEVQTRASLISTTTTITIPPPPPPKDYVYTRSSYGSIPVMLAKEY